MGYGDVVQLLLDKGANIDFCAAHSTALQIAASAFLCNTAPVSTVTYTARSTLPWQAPNPMVPNPSVGLACAVNVMISLSSQNVRCTLPLDESSAISSHGSFPPRVRSRRQPAFSRFGPDSVPVAIRSPVRRGHPPRVW